MVDLRSDTVTKPTQGMKKAMMEALLGDDVYREDPTVSGMDPSHCGTQIQILCGRAMIQTLTLCLRHYYLEHYFGSTHHRLLLTLVYLG